MMIMAQNRIRLTQCKDRVMDDQRIDKVVQVVKVCSLLASMDVSSVVQSLMMAIETGDADLFRALGLSYILGIKSGQLKCHVTIDDIIQKMEVGDYLGLSTGWDETIRGKVWILHPGTLKSIVQELFHLDGQSNEAMTA